MTVQPTHVLLIAHERYKERSCQDYIDYCARIRSEVWHGIKGDAMAEQDKNFLNSTFVNEMEPLAKICQAHFKEQNQGIKVAHVDEQLADGRIIDAVGREIFVEITCSKDTMRIVEAYSQLSNNIIIPLTGPRMTVESRQQIRDSGIVDEPFGEYDEDFVARIDTAVREVLDKKLKKQWQERENWLCIVLDDVTHWQEDLTEQILTRIYQEYSQQLASCHIRKLWFVGYKDWISHYDISPYR